MKISFLSRFSGTHHQSRVVIHDMFHDMHEQTWFGFIDDRTVLHVRTVLYTVQYDTVYCTLYSTVLYWW